MNNTSEQAIAGNGASKNGESIPEPVIRYFKNKTHANGSAPGEQSNDWQQAAPCLSEMVIIEHPLNDIFEIDHLSAVYVQLVPGERHI